MTRRVLLAILLIIPIVRVVSTYRVFSQTFDEPFHIFTGLQWLTTRSDCSDVEHPPLARIAFAIDAFLDGAKPEDGDEMLYRHDNLRRNLALARAGNLPFLVIALVVVMLWTWRLFGENTALITLALFGALPPVLAHAALATTDCAGMAMTLLALYLFWRNANPLLIGAAIGFGLLAKFSFVVFFPMGAIAILISRRSLPRAKDIATWAVLAFFIVWAGYKFNVGRVNDLWLTHPLRPNALEAIAAKYASAPGYEWVRPDLIERYRKYGELAAKHGVTNIDFVDWAKAAGYPSPAAGRSGHDAMTGAPPIPHRLVDRLLEPFHRPTHFIVMHNFPAPQFIAGLQLVNYHSHTGHPAFLLGKYSGYGWWYYFPVVFFFKTPLPFVALCVIGIVLLMRTEHRGVVIAPLLM